MAVISVVNVCFFKKTEIKNREEPRTADFSVCFFYLIEKTLIFYK